ncbi:MAG: permease [Chromatiaceae bacterium]|nr:permease [Chromatiaceae bacterium]
MDIVTAFPTALWGILLELAPSLLVGLLIAGLIHAYVPSAVIRRGLSRPDLSSVVRASLVGVPLPLCSCGVIPTALGLRRQGASPGAATSFMISTPQTGVDSILVTAAFLGWPFALFKLIAAFVTGVVGGALVNRVVPAAPSDEAQDGLSHPDDERPRGGLARITEAVRYAVFDLLGAINTWLVIGVVAAALVTTLTPVDFFADRPWADGMLGMLVMLAIALPLYVCTTASVPIAASLIAAGLPAGSALVFLMAGPATNLATIGAVYRTLGAKVLSVYLGTVVVMSLGFGLIFDQLLTTVPVQTLVHEHQQGWLPVLSALLLLALMAMLGFRQYRAQTQAKARLATLQGLDSGANAGSQQDLAAQPGRDALILEVKGMTCGHCVATVKNALESLEQVHEASPDLATGQVVIRGGFVETETLKHAIGGAGFQLARRD